MPLRYCTLHGIGYRSELDPVCPQCSLGRITPPEPLAVQQDPASPDFGWPIEKDGTVNRAMRTKIA